MTSLLGILLVSTFANAAPPTRVSTSCMREIQSYCASIPTVSRYRILACLSEKRDELAPACLKAVEDNSRRGAAYLKRRAKRELDDDTGVKPEPCYSNLPGA
jgi:hypothetical protein